MSWILALIVSGLAAAILGPLLLPLLRRLRLGQQVRDYMQESQLKKIGTPTMGGLIFLLSTSLAVLATAPWSTATALLLLEFWGFAILGFFDDYLKAVKRQPLGLKARYKLVGQVLLAAVLAGAVALSGPQYTLVQLPFTGLQWQLGPVGYALLIFGMLLGASNGTNLTDGMDGLLAGTAVFPLLAFVALGVWRGQTAAALFAAALAGGLLGFLRLNLHPARVFMGDTGSMAIGAALATLAVLTKTELWLLLLGGLYVVEVLSVILQVLSFRLRGKRILRMSPIHYHFELGGWPETLVVRRFWLFAALLAATTLLAVGRFGR